MALSTLEDFVDAAIRNNELNNVEWKLWRDADHLISTYDQYDASDLTDDERAIIDKAIETNGASIEGDMIDARNGVIGYRWQGIASYMNDEIREEVHAALAPCTRTEFLTEYLKRAPEFYALLESEFKDIWVNF